MMRLARLAQERSDGVGTRRRWRGADAVADGEAPVGQRGRHGQLAQEPYGQGDAAQPAHAGAARRSASALRCDRTLRISLSRVLRL